MTTNLLDDSFNVACRDSSLTSNGYTVRVWVDLVDQDVANNKSIVNIYKTMKGINGWAWNGTAGTDTLSGAASNTVSISQVYPTNTVVSIQSLTNVELSHNSDGTLTTSLTTQWAYGSVYNKYMAAAHNKTYPITLPTIPRASKIALGSNSITVNNTTGSVAYTITPYSSAFTHSLTWSLGTGGGTISNATSGNLTYTQLLNALTNATSGTLTLVLSTLSGSTVIGTKTATANVTIDSTVFKPTLTLGNIAINSSPISGYLVAGYSSAKFDSTASITNDTGASGVTTTFSATNGTLTTTRTTSTSKVTVTTNTLPGSSTNYPLSVNAVAKDSRGVTASGSKTATVYAYAKPTVNLTAYRVASSASTDTDRDDSGAYAYIAFSGTLGASVNGQNSIQSTTCTYSGSVSGTATNGIHIALADNQSITVTCTVADKVSSSTASVIVPTITYPLDLRDDGSGNVSVGLGGLAPEHDTNDFNDGDYILPYLPIRHIEQNYLVNTTGTDLNDYREAGIYYFTSNYTPTNIPVGVNGWLMVLKSPGDAHVKQIWFRQGTNGTNDFDTYVRQYSASAWSSWTKLLTANDTIANATNADNADAITPQVDTNTTAASRYILYLTGNSASRIPYVNNGFLMYVREGTDSQDGFAVLKLGNTTNSGTAGNKYGLLDLYPKTGAYYGRFTTVSTLTANRTYTLPNASGTVLLQAANNFVQLYSGSLTGTNSTTFTYSNYSAYCIVGTPAKYDGSSLDTAAGSVIIPRALITTSDVQWQIGSGTIFSSFKIKYSGTTVTLTKHQGGPVTAVYGIK